MLKVATHATGGGIGHDLFADYTWKKVNYPRILTGIGLCGSTAAFDCEVEMFVGGVSMAILRNLAAGAPTKDHILATSIPVPANALLECKVTLDSTTNPFNFVLEFVP